MTDTEPQRRDPQKRDKVRPDATDPAPRPPMWRVEGRRGDEGADATGTPRGRTPWWVYALVLAGLVAVSVFTRGGLTPAPITVPYSVFRSELNAENVKSVVATGSTITGTFRKKVTYPAKDGATSTKFTTEQPVFAQEDDLAKVLAARKVEVEARPANQSGSVWLGLLLSFGPFVLLGLLWFWMIRRAGRGGGMGGIGGLTGLGRSRAKRYEPSEKRTTFADVAGIDEATEELSGIVDYLRNPDKYRRLGAQIPRGVLLTGPPGTGKTLLARAVAGEAEVPFFSMSASEFIEMIVGVGASRVRDLFEQAKKEAPAIIFIDELDAIGRARGGAMSFGGADEREQTLNQILTEMDGFTGSEGVIVLAATNRPEILDPALLRAGRFDRHVVVNPPDLNGRAAILAVHTRHVPLSPEVNLRDVAAATPGMVGADLRNLVNEAALLAATRGHDSVAPADFSDSIERILLGAERHITLSPEQRRRTAYHESGHALLGMLIPGADPVRKVSIIPRGDALGVTFQSPSSDRYSYDSAYLRGRITGALGGRAAEQLVFGEVTTGAENDLDQATAIARQMVGRWGMSEAIGPVSVLPDPRDERLMFPGASPASESTRTLVDTEVRGIIDRCFADAVHRLETERPRLDRLAEALLERETLDAGDAYEVVGLPPPGDGTDT